MARPQKLTLDWFMHDKDARNDRKIKRVTRKWQAQGYALYFMLLEMLIAEDGMQLSLAATEDAEIVADETFCRDTHHLLAMITSMVEVGLFDQGLWESERIVFSPALYERYRSRIEANRKAAQRKRRSREAQFYQDKQEQLEQSVNNSHTHAIRDLDPEQDPDPDPETDNRSIPIYIASQSDNSRQPCDNPVVTRDNGEDKQALQFMKRPWRKEGGQIEEGFLEFVATTCLPKSKDCGMHPKTKARNHIINLERIGPWAKLEGYWQDYQDASAVQAKPKTTLQAVRQVLTPEEYEAKLRAL